MVGILVHGDNHFILSGPVPDEAAALALSFDQWEIRTKEFRENLEWAVVVPGDGDVSPAVSQLLAELSSRGIAVRRLDRGLE
jgi:hypothetical protein